MVAFRCAFDLSWCILRAIAVLLRMDSFPFRFKYSLREGSFVPTPQIALGYSLEFYSTILSLLTVSMQSPIDIPLELHVSILGKLNIRAEDLQALLAIHLPFYRFV